MKSGFVLEVLSSSPPVTISQLLMVLRFLDMNNEFSTLHVLRMSIYQCLIQLMREGYVKRTDSGMKRLQHKYQITQQGRDYLQSPNTYDIVKKLSQNGILTK